MSAGLLGGKTAGQGPDPCGRVDLRARSTQERPEEEAELATWPHVARAAGCPEDDLARMVLVTVGRAGEHWGDRDLGRLPGEAAGDRMVKVSSSAFDHRRFWDATDVIDQEATKEPTSQVPIQSSGPVKS